MYQNVGAFQVSMNYRRIEGMKVIHAFGDIDGDIKFTFPSDGSRWGFM